MPRHHDSQFSILDSRFSMVLHLPLLSIPPSPTTRKPLNCKKPTLISPDSISSVQTSHPHPPHSNKVFIYFRNKLPSPQRISHQFSRDSENQVSHPPSSPHLPIESHAYHSCASSILPRNRLTPLPQPVSGPLLTARLPLQISSNTPHSSPRHHIRTLALFGRQVRRQPAVEFGVSAVDGGVENAIQNPHGGAWPCGFGVALEFGFEVAGIVGLWSCR